SPQWRAKRVTARISATIRLINTWQYGRCVRFGEIVPPSLTALLATIRLCGPAAVAIVRCAMEIVEMPVSGYERVLRAYDQRTGLYAFIAVHSTALGPALGGCRMWPYATPDEALRDVLRLARGMTYKSALAQTGLGGGKSVIVGNPLLDKTPALM